MASERVHRAVVFAARAHAGQDRKYTGEPYLVHPLRVLRLVADAGGSDDVQVAAVLHDVVEDCDVGLAEIRDGFGERVAELVGWLSDVSRPEDGPRRARKALDRDHLAAAPPEAQTVKLADLIDNTESIVERDPRFASVYMAEKRQLLDVLTKGGERLMRIARARLAEWEAGGGA